MSQADMSMGPGLAACPGCFAGPAEVGGRGRVRGEGTQLYLSLPTIHCAACISTVERALNDYPGVRDARVNLTLKRAQVAVDPDMVAADLVAVLDRVGFEAHELDAGTIAATQTDRVGRELLMRLGVAGFASMNVMLLSVAVWSGAADATRLLFHWVSAAIALPTIVFAAQPFFRNAFAALRRGRMNMDVPISLAIILTSGMSLYETTQGGRYVYYDAAVSLTFLLLAGRYLDHRTRAVARSAAEELAALEVPRAIRLDGEQEEVVPLAALSAGDLIRVLPGGRMPVDGIVTWGTSELDRSLLTGETLPVFAGPGMAVSVGEINLTGPLVLRATAVGRDSSLQTLADLVAMAESGRANYSSLADRAARLYAPGVHILAGLALLGWYTQTGDLRLALNIAVAVLIITCPCALGLAVPAVTTAASGRLFRQGMLIKHATALERLAEVDTVIFDKTGTLTGGFPEPDDLGGHDIGTLAVAAALAMGSAHPLAQALSSAIGARGIAPADIEEITEVPGYGVTAIWQGRLVRLGRSDWVGADDSTVTRAATWLKIGAEAPVVFGFSDALRPGAAQAIADFQAQGVGVQLLSGDSEAAVAALAGKVGITDWTSRALPGAKVARIADLTAAGHKVLMVGDGLNDTAALAAAHVSISPASALDAARVASDIVLLGRDLSAIAGARLTARQATRRIRENFGIAAVYNVLAVPLALFGIVTPLIAALAMSSSSVIVSLNALRLGRVSDTRPRREA